MDLIERLRECCRNVDGDEMAHHAEPWGADVGLLLEAAAALEAAREDGERWRHARKLLTFDDIEGAQGSYDSYGRLISEEECRRADAAIDQARGKGVAS